jgi:hypothetical protein
MGWKSVDRLDIGKGGKRDQYRGKKPDKLGRWHSADVRHYSTNPAGAYLIAPRMKELALWERYVKELSKMSRTKGLLVDWGHCLTFGMSDPNHDQTACNPLTVASRLAAAISSLLWYPCRK